MLKEEDQVKQCTFQPNTTKNKEIKLDMKKNMKRLYEDGLEKILKKKDHSDTKTVDLEFERNKEELSFKPKVYET